MELWRARKEYGRVAGKLRRTLHSDYVHQAEEQFLLAIALIERMTTELWVLRAAHRLAIARLRRLRVDLGRSGVFKHAHRSVALRPDTFAELLASRGYVDLAAQFGDLVHPSLDVQHFERRVNEITERVGRQEALLQAAWNKLFNAMATEAQLAGLAA